MPKTVLKVALEHPLEILVTYGFIPNYYGGTIKVYKYVELNKFNHEVVNIIIGKDRCLHINHNTAHYNYIPGVIIKLIKAGIVEEGVLDDE